MSRLQTHRRQSGRREDGATTKLKILEAAGEVFAEKGVAHAMGKEIAERAGTNSASVNYYFGGVDGLYAEVLVEAHRRLVDYDFLKQLAESPGSPSEKFKVFLNGLVRAILALDSSNWALRVLGREALNPSSATVTLMEKAAAPKKQLVLGFVGEMLGLPPDHPVVERCGLSIVGPFALLVIGSPRMLEEMAPRSAFQNDVDAVVEHFHRFIMGGLSGIAAGIKAERTTAAANEPHS